MTGTEIGNSRRTILLLRHELELASLQQDHKSRKVTELVIELDEMNDRLEVENRQLRDSGQDLSVAVNQMIDAIGICGDGVPGVVRGLVQQLLDANGAWVSVLHDEAKAPEDPTVSEATGDLLDLLDTYIVGTVTKVGVLRKMCRLREAIMREACGREVAMP